MPYIYESGEEVTVGSHGAHEYVYASGEPVTDSGVSDLVYESGTGLGGGLLYAVNGGDLKPLQTQKTAQPHYKFYNEELTDNNFDSDQGTSSADHGYVRSEAGMRVVAHENTDTGSIAILFTFGNNNDGGEVTPCQLQFGQTIASPDYCAVWDGEENQSDEDYWPVDGDYANVHWSGSTDVIGIDVEGFTDTTFKVADTSAPTLGNPKRDFTGWDIVTEESDPPGSGVVNIDNGHGGSLRIVSG